MRSGMRLNPITSVRTAQVASDSRNPRCWRVRAAAWDPGQRDRVIVLLVDSRGRAEASGSRFGGSRRSGRTVLSRTCFSSATSVLRWKGRCKRERLLAFIPSWLRCASSPKRSGRQDCTGNHEARKSATHARGLHAVCVKREERGSGVALQGLLGAAGVQHPPAPSEGS